MKTVIIVQARITSSRLPGKTMLPLEDKTVLGQVLSRCKEISGVDEICCAIPTGEMHDVLVTEAKKYGAIPFRGSEINVLERYYQAAKYLNADTIMRITSDCPLINPKVCEKVLQMHLDNNSQFTCNNSPRTWPHGYDCEAFRIEQLEKAMKHATEPDDFEHVTPWMRRNLEIKNYPAQKDFSHIRCVVDYPNDYEKAKNIFESGMDTYEIETLAKYST
jgi:spore coat polysaccharide biosynthesis protein SpsF (cytidylyltransferase family)